MKFDEFVKNYQGDIKAFFAALIGLIKTIIGKLTGSDATAEDEATDE